jgi:hypothetical protein
MADPVAEASKLPLEERVIHALWKVRMEAYEALIPHINDAESPAE